jgi:hypothetical protein
VIVRSRWLTAALGVSLLPLGSGWAAEPLLSDPSPAPATAADPAANQRVAEGIAARLRGSGRLQHYTIDVAFAGGVAELTGTVADAAQRDAALAVAGTTAGVSRVIDRLQVRTAPEVNPILRVQGDAPPVLPPPTGTDTPPAATPPATPPAPEAVPSFQAPLPSPYQTDPPRMPPYAWPNYAPYNNFSRVGNPMAYPYNAWPFIGPMYPFPKVPLGWRAVKLEWDDGYWWYSKLTTKYNWWRLRYY